MVEGEEREAHFIRRTKSVEREADVSPSWASVLLRLKEVSLGYVLGEVDGDWVGGWLRGWLEI